MSARLGLARWLFAPIALGIVLWLGGYIPTISTIGGHDSAELERWATDATARCLQRTRTMPPYPFTTDGCTLSPDGTWQACCVEHDMVYWCGGTAEARRLADEHFRMCVADHGGCALAPVFYWGVRVGGHPWLPFYWRWGYGWPWPWGYTDADR